MRYRVTLTNTTLGTYILEKEPEGLKDIAPTIRRGENHGIITEVDVKLKFYCNGAGKEYVDQARELGIDEEVNILIEASCDCVDGGEAPDYSIDYSDDYGSMLDGDCDFQEFYTGVLELQTWKRDDTYSEVNIRPAGILQTVKNRLDTKIDLLQLETLDGTALTDFDFGAYDLTLHSRAIELYGEAGNVTIVSEEYTPIPVNDTLYITLPFDFIEVDEIGGFSTANSPFITSLQGSPNVQPVFTNNDSVSVDIELEYNFIGTITDIMARDRTYNLAIVYDKSTGFDQSNPTVTINDYGVKSPLSGVTMSQAVNLSGSLSLTVSPGESLYFYIVFANYDNDAVSPQDATIGLNFTTLELSGTIVSETDPTTAKAFAVFEAGARIAQSITNQIDAFRSNYFGRKNSQPFSYSANGCGSFRALLSGFMVRGYPITGNNARTIKMSMNEYFKGLNPIDNLGMGIIKDGDNYYLVVEKKEFFYDSSTVMKRFNHVPKLRRYEAPEYYYNRVNIGFEKWETEFTNGLDEFNSKRQFDTGIKAVNNPLDIESNLVASGQRLEFARRKQYDATFTEDTEYDEDNFIVCLNKSVDGSGVPTSLDETEKDENFTQVNNLISPETAYNLDISPMRNLLRWNPVINAGLTKYAGREIKFTSGEGNYKMTSETSGSTCPGRWNNNLIAENENVQWDDADNTDSSPIWLPEILEYDYPLTFTEYKEIEADPYGVFEVSETDEDHIKGYILEMKYKEGDVTSFKLLRAYV